MADAGRLMLVALALTVVGAGVTVPSRVEAHALRRSSIPPDGAALAQAPASVTIIFGEEPDPLLSRIEVLDTSGRQYQKGPAETVPGDPRRLVVALGPLPAGVYTVSWTTVSAVDGHRAQGLFAFGVGVPPAAVRTIGPRPPPTGLGGGSAPSPAAVMGRWCLYAGLLLLLGTAVVGSAVFLTPPRTSLVLLPVSWTLAALGTVIAVGAQAPDAGIGVGQLLHTALARSAVERLTAVALSGALVPAALLTHGPRQRAAVALVGLGATGSMLADVAGSHAAAGSLVAANSALQWVHIMAAGVWLGGLAAMLPALRGETGEVKAEAVRRFSTAAAIALVALAVTGTIRAAIEIGAWDRVTSTAFGWLVVVKAGLLAVLVCLGAANRFGNVPRAACSLRGLRRIGSIEVGVAAAALLAAATLVNLAPPTQAAVASARRPAPVFADRAATAVDVPPGPVARPQHGGYVRPASP